MDGRGGKIGEDSGVKRAQGLNKKKLISNKKSPYLTDHLAAAEVLHAIGLRYAGWSLKDLKEAGGVEVPSC